MYNWDVFGILGDMLICDSHLLRNALPDGRESMDNPAGRGHDDTQHVFSVF